VNGERVLAGELVGVSVLVTARELHGGQIPKPRQYMAVLVVYAALSAVALVGDDAAELAAGLGALVLLSALMSFPDIASWVSGFATAGYANTDPPGRDRAAGKPSPLQEFANALKGAVAAGGGGSIAGGVEGGVTGGGAVPVVPAAFTVPTAANPAGGFV
jgi:hypothetical protein